MELKTYFAQDRNGSLIPSATVSIYLTGTTTLATGLKNVAGANLSNPFTADADGKIQFYAPDGIYDMQVSLGSTNGVKVTFQCLDVHEQLSQAESAAERSEKAADDAKAAAESTEKNTFQVSTMADLLDLPATKGDIAIVGGSIQKTFSLSANPASVESNWTEHLNDALSKLASSNQDEGDNLITVKYNYPNAVPLPMHTINNQLLTVIGWGAVDGVDSSVQAQKMINDTGMLIVPEGFTLVAKNLNLSSAKKVISLGKLQLPDGCVDFDRLLYGDGNNSGLQIYINEIDGNRSGQSGVIGTHLLYLTRCERLNVYVKYAHDNYFSRSYTPVASPDGMRQESSGCLFFYQCHKSQFIVDRIEAWGREGIFAYDTDRSVMALGHAQGVDGGDEYSGFQFSGDYNRLLYASVDNSKASCGSFDCRWSYAGPLILTNNKYFGSLGMGHPGFPAEDCVIESVVSHNSAGNGIQFVGNSKNNRILSATVTNASQSGINQSDGAKDNCVNNFVIRDSGLAQVTSFQNNLVLTNGDLTANANGVPKLSATGGGSFAVRNVRLSATIPMTMQGFNGLAGNASATITNENITPYSHIILYPANANAAAANAYISSIANGSCVLSTQSGAAAGSGASFRYMVV